MAIKPRPGLVIHYDFLWKEDERAGKESSDKDHPSAIMMMSKPTPSGDHLVYLCPISHSPPRAGETAVELPPKVSRYLGLDGDRQWLKTHQINQVFWEKDRIPFGVAKNKAGNWEYGEVPKPLAEQAFAQLQENAKSKELKNVIRDNALERYRRSNEQKPPEPENDHDHDQTDDD